MEKRKLDGKRKRRRGVEIIEFTLVLLPLLGFTFLLLDLGWVVYRRATLQFAVREGCRYAVTNQVRTDLKDANGNSYGMVDSVKAVVQSSAMGFLGNTPSGTGWASIQVRFYAATGNMTTPIALPANCSVKTPGPNASITPNLVEVSVENYQAGVFAPLMRSATPLNLTARSIDRMESIPRTGAPPLLTCP
jgi:Flp pilus assembly protein TadG